MGNSNNNNICNSKNNKIYIMKTSIEMLIDELTKNIVPTDQADETDLARNGAFHVAINYARVFEQREKDLILSAFDSKFKGTAQEFYNACFAESNL